MSGYKNKSVYAIFNDQSFNDTLTNDIVNFEQLIPGLYCTVLVLPPIDVALLRFLLTKNDLFEHD